MPHIGPIDPSNEAHDMIMSTFGSLSKGERNRIRVRVRGATAAQAQMEGRYVGGRPPYRYLLIDAGPHPNPAEAADGKRLYVLAIDEPAAIVVARIFAELLAGFVIFAIAERLTRDGIRARQLMTGPVTGTAAAWPGPRAQSARSSPTPATPAASRSKTANGPTRRRLSDQRERPASPCG